MKSMKGLVFIATVALSMNIAAALKTIKVQNFKGNYSDPNGKATSSLWNIGGKQFTNVTFRLKKENTQMRLIHPEGEDVFDNLPEQILTAKSAVFNALNIKTNGNRVDFNVDQVSINGADADFNLSKFAFACAHNTTYSVELEKYLDICTTHANFIANEINIGTTNNLTKVLNILNPNKLASSTKIEKLNIRVIGHKLEFDAKVVTSINGNGTIQFAKSNGDNFIVVRLDKVKASFFNITNKIFTELENNLPSGVSVKRPYIYIKI